MAESRKPSYLNFDKENYLWKPGIDYRAHPEQYRVGKGEQGVLICEPYKGELATHWRFKTPEIATESSQIIFHMFETYLHAGEFVGADMARKFLQMGYTRARRYTNFKGGRKYDKEHDYALNEKGTGDPIKAESARIFYEQWKRAEANTEYAVLKREWKERYG